MGGWPLDAVQPKDEELSNQRTMEIQEKKLGNIMEDQLYHVSSVYIHPN